MKKLPILFSAALFLLGFGAAAALGSSAAKGRHDARVAPVVRVNALHRLADERNLLHVEDGDDTTSAATTPVTEPTTTDTTPRCEEDADGDDAQDVESSPVTTDDDECEPTTTVGDEDQAEHEDENRGPRDGHDTTGHDDGGGEHRGSGHDGAGHDGGDDD